MIKNKLSKIFFFLVFILSICSECFSQDYEKTKLSQNNYEHYQNYYKSYQNYYNPNQGNFQGNNTNLQQKKQENDFSLQKNNRSNENSQTINYPTLQQSLTNQRRKNAFEDGFGEGYRIYDSVNRQSYFCSNSKSSEMPFRHQDNFNGIYVGFGYQSISSDVTQKVTSNSLAQPSSSATPKSQNFNGTSSTGVLLIGQGRLFSTGLYLGQEAAINIGTATASTKTVDTVPGYDKMSMTAYNFSSYSGKIGYQVLERFLPYFKLSFSLSPIRYTMENSTSKIVSTSDGPSFAFGVGVDFSISEHVRLIVDYSKWSLSEPNSGDTINITKSGTTTQYSIKYEGSMSVARASLAWRF